MMTEQSRWRFLGKLVTSDKSMNSVRLRTIEAVNALGVQINPSLPCLESNISVCRSTEELAGRMLSMSCVVSLSFDMSRQTAISSWAQRENVIQYMTENERGFLAGDSTNRATMQWRVEALFALAWATTLSKRYQPLDLCPDDLSSHFPSIRKGESSKAFRERLQVRSAADLVGALDIYYCLHWCISDAMLRGKKSVFRWMLRRSLSVDMQWSGYWLWMIGRRCPSILDSPISIDHQCSFEQRE